MRTLVLVAALACAACSGGTSSCAPALPAVKSCPPSTFIDASVNDPICLASSGLPYCRGDNDAVCYVCTGASFDDGCQVTSPQMTIECVHSCSKC
jgi:hypothetical protein